jgi:hypothetical protein
MGLPDPSETSSMQLAMENDATFEVAITMQVRDAALLWRMAAAHALATTGLDQSDVEDVIGPMDDPSLPDCIAMLLAPRNIAGCSFSAFRVDRRVKPTRAPRSARSRRVTPRGAGEQRSTLNLFPG